jgi:hypothetical protein
MFQKQMFVGNPPESCSRLALGPAARALSADSEGILGIDDSLPNAVWAGKSETRSPHPEYTSICMTHYTRV